MEDDKEILFINEKKEFYQKVLSFGNDIDFHLFKKFKFEDESIPITLIDNCLSFLQIDTLKLNLYEIEDFYIFREKLLRQLKDPKLFKSNESDIDAITNSLMNCDNIRELSNIMLECYLNVASLFVLVNNELKSFNKQYLEKINYILFTILLNFKKQFSSVNQIKKAYIHTYISKEKINQLEVNDYITSQQLSLALLEDTNIHVETINCVMEIHFSILDKFNYFSNYVEILPVEKSIYKDEILISPFTKFKIHSIENINQNYALNSIEFRIKVRETSDNLIINTVFSSLLNAETQKNQFYFEKMIDYYDLILNCNVKLTNNDMSILYFNKALIYYYSQAYRESKEEFLICSNFLHENQKKNVFWIYNFLGSIGNYLLEFDEAFKYYDKAKNLAYTYFEERGNELFISHFNLGQVYFTNKKYESMIKEFEICLDLLNLLKDKDELEIANIHEFLALGNNELEDFKKAVESYQISNKIKSKIFCENTIVIATNLNNLACCYFNLKEYPKALECFEKSLNIRIKIQGENNSCVATINNNMGLIYDNLNKDKLAEEKYEKALKISLEINGLYDQNTATYYSNLGGICEKLEKYTKAIEHYKNAVKIQLVMFGENSFSLCKIYHRIGNIHHILNNNINALSMYEKAQIIKISLLGENDLSVAYTYNYIGMVNEKLKLYNKAIEAFEQSLRIYKKIYQNQENASTATAYNNIGSCYFSLGNFEEAIKYLSKSLQMRIVLFGNKNSSTMNTFRNIEIAYKSISDKKKIEEYMTQFNKLKNGI